MRAIISHGDNRACPSVTLEGASHCPGHEVVVPEYGDEMFRHAILLAADFGYRSCERGDNLQKCLADVVTFLK